MSDIPLTLSLLSLAGLLVLIHAAAIALKERTSEHSYWLRVTPAVALTAMPSAHATLFGSADARPVMCTVTAAAALLCAYGIHRAYRTRPLPPWYGGAHERIDQP